MALLDGRKTRLFFLSAIVGAALAVCGCVDQGTPTAPSEAVMTRAETTTGLPADIESAIDSEDDHLVLAAANAVEIDGPVVITEPGMYRVTTDFKVPAGDAIVIRASHVYVSLDGHSITGPGNKSGRGIVIDGVNHVLVTDGRLQTFGIGVALLRTSHSAVRRLRIRGGDEFADPANGIAPQIGILLVNSSENRVRRTRLDGVNLGLFVRGGGSYKNSLRRNEVTGGAHGLLAICYNPAPAEGDPGPHDDNVTENELVRFRTGIQTSPGSMHNHFTYNKIRYFTTAWSDLNGTNEFRHNRVQRIPPR